MALRHRAPQTDRLPPPRLCRDADADTARYGARTGRGRGRRHDPLARRRRRDPDGRGAPGRAARRGPRPCARGPRLRRHRAQRATERGDRAQAREPRAQGAARAHRRKPMSSDYIPRLREELLRAGAQRQAHWRPARALRPLVPVAAVALIVAALVVAWPAGGEDESAAPQPTTTKLAYRTDPVRADEVAQILRTRLAHAGVDARVAVSGGRLTITAPEDARADVAALTQRGSFAIYDWET